MSQHITAAHLTLLQIFAAPAALHLMSTTTVEPVVPVAQGTMKAVLDTNIGVNAKSARLIIGWIPITFVDQCVADLTSPMTEHLAKTHALSAST